MTCKFCSAAHNKYSIKHWCIVYQNNLRNLYRAFDHLIQGVIQGVGGQTLESWINLSFHPSWVIQLLMNSSSDWSFEILHPLTSAVEPEFHVTSSSQLPSCSVKLGCSPAFLFQFFANFDWLTAWNGQTDTWIDKYERGQWWDGWMSE